MTPSRLLAGALALLSALAPAAAAGAETLTSRYSVSLVGLPVGEASFDTTIGRGSYSIEGTLSSAGLASLVSSIRGSSSSAGRIRGDRIVSERYGLRYSSDRKSYSSSVAFRSGRVASAEVAPAVTNPKPDYVRVTRKHLAAVVDPLGGLLIKARGGNPQSVCKRTLPFFDGWSRLDLQMSAAGTRPFRTDGYDGEAIVCNVRVKAVSGYRTSSRGVTFIQKHTIELWFAPIRDTGIYAPVRAKIPTEVGSLIFNAETFVKG